MPLYEKTDTTSPFSKYKCQSIINTSVTWYMMISMESTDLGQTVAGLPGMIFFGDGSGQACNEGIKGKIR